MAARDAALADAIAQAVRDFDPRLILVGLAGSALPQAGARLGLAVAHEAFADRRARADGSLTPRREQGAVIEDIDSAVAQAVQIATCGNAPVGDGGFVAIRADTICVHGDRPNAAAFAQHLHAALQAAGVSIGRVASEKPLSPSGEGLTFPFSPWEKVARSAG
jgi:UPF0271 protein